MERTRASIQDTVDELKGKVGQTVDWRHYVSRYPGATLMLAMAAGLVVGRGLAALMTRNDGVRYPERYGYGGAAEAFGESELTPAEVRAQAAYQVRERAAGATSAVAGATSAARQAVTESVGQSLGKIGSRVERIVHRLIDEVADTLEQRAVPALTSAATAWLNSLLDLGPESRARRPAGSRPDPV
ncbi:MAG TPA: hypothetical protein VGW35_21470 [Methylomirabilota bacterium]|jgi:hypothetical protein|nr:hypothetical protein [Methylomirabilota bacterium]